MSKDLKKKQNNFWKPDGMEVNLDMNGSDYILLLRSVERFFTRTLKRLWLLN